MLSNDYEDFYGILSGFAIFALTILILIYTHHSPTISSPLSTPFCTPFLSFILTFNLLFFTPFSLFIIFLSFFSLEQFHVYSDPSRDKRRHTVSAVFRCIAKDAELLKKGISSFLSIMLA